MKLKTKRRLRRLLTPMVFVWACVATMLAFAGAFVLALGFKMLGEQEKAKDLIRELI